MFCTKCGSTLKENAKFCTVCGAPQVQVAAQDQVAEQPAPLSQAVPEQPAPLPQAVPEQSVQQQTMQPAPAADATRNCPYCMQQISAEAKICPYCRKKLKKKWVPFAIAGGIAAVAVGLIVTLIVLFSKGIIAFGTEGKIKASYDQIFKGVPNGSIRMADGEHEMNGYTFANDIARFGNVENPNTYNSFATISSQDATRLWQISMSQYDYEIVNVEKQEDKRYLVEVDVSNRNTYQLMDYAIDEFNQQYAPKQTNGWDVAGDILGAVLDANQAYSDSEGGFLGGFGQALATGSSLGNSLNGMVDKYGGNDAYYNGMNDGSNAHTIVDFYEQYAAQGISGYTSKNRICFYAEKDAKGRYVIPENIMVGSMDTGYSINGYEGVYYAAMGND